MAASLSWKRLQHAISSTKYEEDRRDLVEEREKRIGELGAIWGAAKVNAIKPELLEDFYAKLMTAQEPCTIGELAAGLRGVRGSHAMLFGRCHLCDVRVPVLWTGVEQSRLPEPICCKCGRSVLREFKEALSSTKQ